jgi:hypothetical protein
MKFKYGWPIRSMMAQYLRNRKTLTTKRDKAEADATAKDALVGLRRQRGRAETDSEVDDDDMLDDDLNEDVLEDSDEDSESDGDGEDDIVASRKVHSLQLVFLFSGNFNSKLAEGVEFYSKYC